MIDDIFLIESPEFNCTNPLVSFNDLENLDVDENHKHNLYQLRKIWLDSMQDEQDFLQLRKNRNTLKVLNELVNKQKDADDLEDHSLMRRLLFVTSKKILTLREFKQEERLKELENVEKKDAFKGFKCELKTTSIDVNILIKNLKLNKNYFDHSSEIIED